MKLANVTAQKIEIARLMFWPFVNVNIFTRTFYQRLAARIWGGRYS
jgi:hypothetical protein